MSGWICSYRQMWDHHLFRGNAQRVGVWHWLMHNACWKETKYRIGSDTITLSRGQVCLSHRQVEQATGMGRKAFSTFLKALEAENAVVVKSHHDARQGKTIVTICNYDKYQSEAPDLAPEGVPDTRQERATKEQGKHLNNIPTSSEAADATPLDPAKVMFDAGRSLLMAAGKSKDQAGKLLGRWRSDHGAEAVIAALGRAQREGAIDPVSFIEGCLRFSERQKKPYKTDRYGNPEIGATKVNAKGDHYRYVNHFDGWMREDA